MFIYYLEQIQSLKGKHLLKLVCVSQACTANISRMGDILKDGAEVFRN